MSKYKNFDIIKMDNLWETEPALYRIKRVTPSFYEVEALQISTPYNNRKAFIIKNADADPHIKLYKRDIAHAFRNL